MPITADTIRFMGWQARLASPPWEVSTLRYSLRSTYRDMETIVEDHRGYTDETLPRPRYPLNFREQYTTRYILMRDKMRRFGRELAKTGIMKNKVLDLRRLDDLNEHVDRFRYGPVLSDCIKAFYPVSVEITDTYNDKVDRGEWEPVPWSDEGWWRASPYRFIHGAHIATMQPTNIAFVESAEKFAQDRYTSTKPGRYLTRFFGDRLSENEIRDWAEKCAARALPAELHFAESNDPDEWVRVYENGPESCMQGMKAVKVYAHPKSVLRLAYLTRGDDIVARCIVREDAKEFIRCYPNTDSTENQRWHTRIRTELGKLGYEHGTLSGVLLDAIEDGGGEYVMPYLDTGSGGHGGANCVNLVHLNGRDYFRVGSDGTPANSTGGTICMEERAECSHCGEMFPADELTYVESIGEDVCESCLDADFVLARDRGRAQEYVPVADAILCRSNDTYYTSAGAQYHDIYQCEDSGDYYSVDDLTCTSRGWLHLNVAVELDVKDGEGHSFAHPSDVRETSDGRTIHRNCVMRVNDKVYHCDDDMDEINEANKTEEE